MRAIGLKQGILVITAIARAGLVASGPASASPYVKGDLVVSIGAWGQVKESAPDGKLVQTLRTGHGGSAGGLAFDNSGSLYVSDGVVSKFDPSGTRVAYRFGSGYVGGANSITFDRHGEAYVGQGLVTTREVLKFDRSGNLVASYSPAQDGDSGTWWVALGPDDCTLYYTTGVLSTSVKRFDVCTNRQLPDFVDGLTGDFVSAIRPLPDGGLLVVDQPRILRFDCAGRVVRTYQDPPPVANQYWLVNQYWLGLDLAPDGSAFWASSEWELGSAVEFDLGTGTVLRSFGLGEYGAGALTVVGSASARAPWRTCSCRLRHLTGRVGAVVRK